MQPFVTLIMMCSDKPLVVESQSQFTLFMEHLHLHGSGEEARKETTQVVTSRIC